MPDRRVPVVAASPELIQTGDVLWPNGCRYVAAGPASRPEGEDFWLVPTTTAGWSLVVRAGTKVEVERRPQPPQGLTPEEQDAKADDYRPPRWSR
jgi:hypothetical protein